MSNNSRALCVLSRTLVTLSSSERVVGNASLLRGTSMWKWKSRRVISRRIFLYGSAAIRRLDGNTHLVRRSETDRQPVYDIQRAHEDALTLAHSRHIRGVSKPLEKQLRFTSKVAYDSQFVSAIWRLI